MRVLTQNLVHSVPTIFCLNPKTINVTIANVNRPGKQRHKQKTRAGEYWQEVVAVQSAARSVQKRPRANKIPGRKISHCTA